MFFIKIKKEPQLRVHFLLSGGEKGIRTLDTFLYTRFPVVRLRPTRPSLHKGL